MREEYVSAIRAGLASGAILVLCELAFGIALYLLRPSVLKFIENENLSSIMPVAIVWLAFIFFVLVIYATCGMLTAKRLIATPVDTVHIIMLGALAVAIAEMMRSAVAIVINFALSMLSPLDVSASSGMVLSQALISTSIRVLCVLPAFIILAAIISAISAYAFSNIFFKVKMT